MTIRKVFCLSLVFFSPFAWSAGGVVTDPTGTAPDRYVYYPGTEELGEKEIRVTACGTGLPGARRGQAGEGWCGRSDPFRRGFRHSH